MTHRGSRLGLIVGALALSSACAQGIGDDDERTVFIGPQPISCMAMMPTQCMPQAPTAQGPWSYMFVWAIEGFEYQPGFLYELRIREFEDPKPPADAPSTRRVLIRLVSKTPVG